MGNRAGRLHAADNLGVFYVTGGGSLLLSDVLTQPGASRTVLEASVPYATTALAERLGGPPERASSASTAGALAMVAWQRAQALAPQVPAQQLFGFGLTGALATDRPRRGRHRAYLALQTANVTHQLHIEFDKADTSRAREEQALVDAAYFLLQNGLDLALNAQPPAHGVIDPREHGARPGWRGLLTGSRSAYPERGAGEPPAALLPGAFNPLHAGHLGMAEHASSVLGGPIAFELCVRNVDKPALTYAELSMRCDQFDHSQDLWLTTLPTFVEKARRFPGCVFVLGIDTLVRVGEARYYGSSAARDRALDEIAALGNRFLAFGRSSDSVFETLASVALPPALRRLCDGVSEAEFRNDLSSTQLRRQRAAE